MASSDYPYPRHVGISIGKRTSLPRHDVKKLKLKKALIPLQTGEYFRETPLEWQIYNDLSGKIRSYPKADVLGIIT